MSGSSRKRKKEGEQASDPGSPVLPPPKKRAPSKPEPPPATAKPKPTPVTKKPPQTRSRATQEQSPEVEVSSGLCAPPPCVTYDHQQPPRTQPPKVRPSGSPGGITPLTFALSAPHRAPRLSPRMRSLRFVPHAPLTRSPDRPQQTPPAPSKKKTKKMKMIQVTDSDQDESVEAAPEVRFLPCLIPLRV